MTDEQVDAPVADERAPLLPSSHPGSPSRTSPQNVSAETPRDSVEDDPLSIKPRKLTPGAIAWRVALLLFIGALVAITIKNSIDTSKPDPNPDFDFGKALKKALGGGLSGAAAMVLQVATLMPLRTIMNYQYRFGTTFGEAAKTLYSDGGYGRYYQGVGAALIQGPIARFGDTAANAGGLALLDSNPTLRHIPAFIKSIFASMCAAVFRMVLTPVDTLKTTLQTQGKKGWAILRTRIQKYGIGSLWYGAVATAAATFVGHYPWFSTYNTLKAAIPVPESLLAQLGRNAVIGFSASVISDTVSNSLRVVKTYRQVNDTRISYTNAARNVIAADGIRGLFFRGLGTRILTNGLQSIMFTILWSFFLDLWDQKTKALPGTRFL